MTLQVRVARRAANQVMTAAAWWAANLQCFVAAIGVGTPGV